jgi:hypothetical protein
MYPPKVGKLGNECPRLLMKLLIRESRRGLLNLKEG